MLWKVEIDKPDRKKWVSNELDRRLIVTYLNNRWRTMLYAKISTHELANYEYHDKMDAIDKAAEIRIEEIRNS